MNIEAEKAMIIEKVKQVSDIDLISAIKSMLDYAQKRDQKVYDIPEAHQNLVMERFDETRKNSERLLDWTKVKETLKNK
jgi:hypothetical protein